MLRQRTLDLLLVFVLGGCDRAPPPPHGVELQRFIRDCGMTRQMDLKFVGPGEVTAVILREDANHKGFMCVLRELEARKLKFGIIGSEANRP